MHWDIKVVTPRLFVVCYHILYLVSSRLGEQVGVDTTYDTPYNF